MAIDGTALVLGGGGITGIAWETGLLYGLAEEGVDLTAAGQFVGTSAGSVVAAQLTSGTTLSELYEAQLEPPTTEIPARIGPAALARFVVASVWPGDRTRGRARLGKQALRARTVSEADRRAVIGERLPTEAWPVTPLRIVAVEALTGRERVFTAADGVSLIDAVAASCAVPLVWPPVTIDGVRYVDGGVRSPANADLVEGASRVVVLAPIVQAARRADRPGEQIGSTPYGIVLSPDPAARAAIGRNVLDPAFRKVSAEAGRRQAKSEAARVSAVWGG